MSPRAHTDMSSIDSAETASRSRGDLPSNRIWFDASITPSRSLRKQDAWLPVLLVLAPSSVLSALLLRMGLGLSALAALAQAAAALSAVFWKSRDLARVVERVQLTDQDLIVHSSGSITTRSLRLDPAWLRVERTVHAAVGCERLVLVSGGRRATIAACLSPDERAGLADALEDAIQRRRTQIRRGPLPEHSQEKWIHT